MFFYRGNSCRFPLIWNANRESVIEGLLTLKILSSSNHGCMGIQWKITYENKEGTIVTYKK